MPNPNASANPASLAGYHEFQNDDGEAYGSFEIFWNDGSMRDDEGESIEAGWYWWACFPGCLPDSDGPYGPFETSAIAYCDAQQNGIHC